MSGALQSPEDEAAQPRGFQLLGLVREKGSGSLRKLADAGDAPLCVHPHREIAALLQPVQRRIPVLSREEVSGHHRIVDRVMRRTTVVPAPFGLVFLDLTGVARFLAERYLQLDEALALVDGRWEYRLHARQSPEADPALARDAATHAYGELRRLSRLATPLADAEGAAFSAAFLVDRAATRRFVERVEEMGHPLVLDLTGPWPPYDFVRITP